MHRSLAFLLSGAVIAVAASCAPERASSPTGMRERAEQAARGRPDETPGDSVDVVATCGAHGPAVGVALVGPRGGTVVADGVQLVVPPGALDVTVPIVATVPAGSASAVRFEPEGLRFNAPVRLVLPGAGCALGDGALAVDYIGDDGAVLERLPAHLDPTTGAVTTQIVHFSIYAVAVRQGAAPQ